MLQSFQRAWVFTAAVVALTVLGAAPVLRADDPAAKTGTIKGVVTKNGMPVASSTVRLAAVLQNTVVKNVPTDEKGQFIFEAIAEGDYKVLAGNNPMGWAMQNVQVRSGQSVELTLIIG